MRGRAFWTAGAILVATTSACSSEPDFDERYDAAKKTIGSQAANLEEDMSARSELARETGLDDSADPDGARTSATDGAPDR